MKIEVREWSETGELDRERLFARSEIDIEAVAGSVADIIAKVKIGGDAAVRAFTAEFDGADLGRLPLEVTEDEYRAAESKLSAGVRGAIEYAVANVRSFHEHQKPAAMEMKEIRPGLYAGERAIPIDSAGLYIPMGRGSFPSMLYMMAVPAALAGVPSIVVVTPPTADGTVDPACLVTARLCGVHRVFRIGGAQAVAALAYGTESVPRVVKIVGPGSMYVTAAKRLLHGVVDVGLPAGPSESVVLADGTANPWRVALDLLVEAEHGSDSSAVLVTPSRDLARTTAVHMEGLIEDLPEPRRGFVRDVFSLYGGIIRTSSMQEALDFVNRYAPEHLLVNTENPLDLLGSIRNAGEILLGPDIPFSLANYAAGANAVLPTGGKARTWSPVSVRDFMKYSSVVYATRRAYEAVSEHVVALADYEGFVTHANAFRLRDEDPGR